ncbi:MULTISPECIES: hypothetical protein [unclassified Glutamicibacter]|uniref:hypothetical protein n=1 Tax=unclassified Glutamicibacter TaxID=2627139 RepID=UPI003830D3AD
MESISKPLPVPMILDTRAEWFEAANAGMDTLIARNTSFTADDLRDLVPMPANPNWVGAIFKGYQSMKLIRTVGFELSRSSSRRGGSLRRWVGVKHRATA